MYDLLTIDLDKHTVPLKPLFEEDVEPEFYDSYTVNQVLLSNLTKSFFYLDYVTLLTTFMSAVTKDDPVAYIKSIKEMDEKSICISLNIAVPLNTYKLYSVVQSILYKSKKERVDATNKVMLVKDLAYVNNAENMIKAYVKTQHNQHYVNLKRVKNIQEFDIAIQTLVNRLIFTDSISEFKNLFKNGLTLGNKKYSIDNTTGKGYIDLVNAFSDLALDIPLRLEKLVLFMLGRTMDQQEIIWNNGNTIPKGLATFKDIFDNDKGRVMYASMKEYYKTHGLHIYRSAQNRHGHGNDKPSYWAMGYETLEEMIDSISAIEWIEYKDIHHNCCGINLL